MEHRLTSPKIDWHPPPALLSSAPLCGLRVCVAPRPQPL